MFVSQVQKDSDGEYFLEIPESEISRLDLSPGDTIRMDLKRVPTPSENPEEFQKLLDQEIEGIRDMLEHFKDQ